MSILRSKMIDLSQPHLIPERMRSFMVEYFDYLAAGTPEIRDLDSLMSKFGQNLLYTPIDADFQNNMLLADMVESELKKQNPDHSC